MKASKLLTLVSIIASLLILTLAGSNAWKEREQVLDEARQRLSDQSLTLAEQMERSLQASDLVLGNMVEELGRDKDWKSQNIHLQLKNYATALPQIRGVAVVDVSGNIVNDSALFPATPIFLGDREYFTRLRVHPKSGMYISIPLKSRRDNEWTVVLTRPITGKDGSFQGLVFARMQPKYFQDIFQKILHQEGAALSVLRRDGTMLFRQPHDEKSVGWNLAATPLFTKYLPASDRGVFEKFAEIDGKLRVFSYSALGSYPIVIVAHQEKAAILANWRLRAMHTGVLVGFFVLISFILTWRLALSLRQGEEDSETVKESEQKLRFMTENMVDVIWTWELGKGFTFVSPSIERLLGYTPDELLGKPLEGLCAQSTLDKVQEKSAEAREMAAAGAAPPLFDLTFETHVATKTGALLWMENRLRLFFHADGSQSRIQGLSRNITERKHMEDALRLQASVFENTQEGILITDAEQRIISINSAFTRMTGYSEADMLGKSPHKIQSGQHDAAYYQEMWRGLSETGHWRGEIWNRKKNGELYAGILHISAVKNPQQQVTHYVGLYADITDIKHTQQQLENLANFDALTSLPNRVLLADRMQLALSQAKRHLHLLAVCLLDLDNFKPINDRYGHETGDHLLIQVAQRLKQAIREGDTVARLGGDEFVLLLTNLGNAQEIEPMLKRVLSDLAAPYIIDGIDMRISASIGVTLYPPDEENPDILLRHADQAMYHAKQAGRNRFLMYDKERTFWCNVPGDSGG